MTVFGDGEQQRAFSYVGDIVGPIARAAWTPAAFNRVFNVGADLPYTVNDLATAVASAMGKPGHPVKHLEARNEVKIAYSDHTAAREVFGDEAHVSLDQGLARMATWVHKVGARESSKFEAIEVMKKMPPSWAEALLV